MAKQFILTEFESAGLSVAGPVRTDNQDAILMPSSPAPSMAGCLHAVADGMGGYSNGALASSMALQNFLQVVRSSSLPAAPEKVLKQALETANFEVYKASQRLDNVRMGTTLTAAYISGNLMYLAHVGDSRAYLVRQGRVTCLSSDHSVVGDMLRARLISADQLRSHAQRSVLTRAVGLGLFVQPEISQTSLQIGDRIILCSDGIWSFIEDSEFADICSAAAAPQALASRLVDLAVERETDDNCSAVVIHIRGFRYQTFEEAPKGEHGWFDFFRK